MHVYLCVLLLMNESLRAVILNSHVTLWIKGRWRQTGGGGERGEHHGDNNQHFFSVAGRAWKTWTRKIFLLAAGPAIIKESSCVWTQHWLFLFSSERAVCHFLWIFWQKPNPGPEINFEKQAKHAGSPSGGTGHGAYSLIYIFSFFFALLWLFISMRFYHSKLIIIQTT